MAYESKNNPLSWSLRRKGVLLPLILLPVFILVGALNSSTSWWNGLKTGAIFAVGFTAMISFFVYWFAGGGFAKTMEFLSRCLGMPSDFTWDYANWNTTDTTFFLTPQKGVQQSLWKAVLLKIVGYMVMILVPMVAVVVCIGPVLFILTLE